MEKPAPLRPPLRDDALSPAEDRGRVLDRLWDTVEARRGADAEDSYTARLLRHFPHLPSRKFGEEATECVIEAVGGDRRALVGESADLLYHLVVLLVGAGLSREAVFGELASREDHALRRGAPERRVRRKARAVSTGTRKIP